GAAEVPRGLAGVVEGKRRPGGPSPPGKSHEHAGPDRRGRARSQGKQGGREVRAGGRGSRRRRSSGGRGPGGRGGSSGRGGRARGGGGGVAEGWGAGGGVVEGWVAQGGGVCRAGAGSIPTPPAAGAARSRPAGAREVRAKVKARRCRRTLRCFPWPAPTAW